jgi:FAD/FMN-containing dehydrogenase
MALSMFAPTIAASYAAWQDPGADRVCRGWVRASGSRVASITAGHYIGEVDLEAGSDRARRSFAKANWDRLAALKARHDPENVFHWFLGAG